MPATSALLWPLRPRVSAGGVLGKRQTWRSKCRQYQIERFPEGGSGKYICCENDELGWRVIGACRTLRAAKRRCNNAARRGQPKKGKRWASTT